LIRETLGAIVLLQSPLSASSLARLLRVPAEDVHRTLYELHLIVDVPQDQNRPVRLHHPSFRDFLLNRERCGDDSFWVDKSSTHKKLARCCLDLMTAHLRQDMCNLLDPGVLQREINRETIDRNLPPELQYACRYWISHLKQSQQHVVDGDTTHLFLQKHLLNWLEAMSLMRESSSCVHLLDSLQALAGVRFSLNFLVLLADVERSYLQALFQTLFTTPSELSCDFNLCLQMLHYRSIALHLCSHQRTVLYDALLSTKCYSGSTCSL
jgi:hypothetical protein